MAYVTNVTLQHGVENATLSARYAVEDTRTYLKSTSYHIRHLLVNNYGELKEHLFHTLDKTSDTVVMQLDKASNAVSLDQLHTIVEALPEVQQDLLEMDKITRDMQQKASQLNDGELRVKILKSLQLNEYSYLVRTSRRQTRAVECPATMSNQRMQASAKRLRNRPPG